MFRLSKEQLQALSLHLQDDFLKRTASHLLANFPAELAKHGLQSNQLEQLIQRGVNEAESFGVVHEHDVRLYIECMVVLHPRFAWAQDTPWFGEVLRREDLSGTEKMDMVHDQLVFGLYEDGLE
ncbi:hypothetical protein [Archangium sp.]|uniref:hypothetical protein n=1 Tax=Archangium sp. TaxID=1872627 RepID=UPI002D3A7186|nr:hypothetical protein [Archangium sp.]HYO55259.1 hypothetical protein [Archangium sp.]